MTNLSKVWDIWTELSEDDKLLHDRREYDQEQLQKMYDLDDVQASYLRRMIQYVFDPDYKDLYTYMGCSAPPSYVNKDHERRDRITEMLGESLHQGLDGWEPHEKVIIMMYLMDIGIACGACER